MKEENQRLKEASKALMVAAETKAKTEAVGEFTAYAELELEDNTGIWVECVADPDQGGKT
jgi:catabolite regulation protein CreA